MSMQEKERMGLSLNKEIEDMKAASAAKEEQISGMEQQML